MKEITVPGSKSYTNRSLILAVLTKNKVKIIKPLFSDDTEAMVYCLKTLGINTKVGGDYILVEGDISKVKEKKYKLDCNLSGTTLRFILALSCLIPGEKIIYGKNSLNKRPIGPLVDGLKKLGAKIRYLGKVGYPPITIESSKLNSGEVKVLGDISSQYFSALLMIAPIVGDLKIKVLGKQISKPYIDMTIDIMEKFGVKVINNRYKSYFISRQRYSRSKYIVEGDYSSAAYFLAIAALTGSEITIKNLNPYSKQADKKFVEILEKMGNKIIWHKNSLTIKGKGIKALEIDMEDCPDQVQTLAILSSFAKGKTIITGVRSLRIKETERVKALEKELSKMGIKTKSGINKLTIFGGEPKGATINTYNDHRMAMSFAVAASILPIKIKNPEVVSKSFPDFWKNLEEMGVNYES